MIIYQIQRTFNSRDYLVLFFASQSLLQIDRRQMSFMLQQDALDTVPGFKNWKLISVFGAVLCAGLLIVGAATGTIGKNADQRNDYLLERIELTDRKTRKPIANSWTLIHFLGFFLASLIFPESWAVIWTWGLAWELFEFSIGWHRWEDIAANTAGILLGVAMTRIFVPLGRRLDVKDRQKSNKADIDAQWAAKNA